MSAQPHHPTRSHCPDRSRDEAVPSGISLVQLLPDERLRLESGSDQFVCVLDGILYLAIDEDDVILTPGDQIVISAGRRHVAWNAGDESARVIVGDRTAPMHA